MLGTAVNNFFKQVGGASGKAFNAFTPAGWRAGAEAAKAAEAAAAAPKGFGKFWEAFSDKFPKTAGTAETVAEMGGQAAGWTGNKIMWAITRPIVWPFKLGMKLIELPLTYLIVKPATAIVSGIGTLFGKAPREMAVVTGLGAAVGIGSYVAKRRTNAMMGQYAAAQDAAMQAAAAQEMAAAQPSYKNSASQADVDAALAAGRSDSSTSGHAAKVAENRAAAAATQQPLAPAV